MRNIFIILQREFATYFNSPIGYIYIIVFVLLNAILFVPSFWAEPNSDVRSMFDRMPLLLCILLPLVSMRLWAEDRKENTIEMLLTFPIPSYQIVLGKYLASVGFFVVALLGTLTIPFTIGWLGDPDKQVIASSYLGLFLLGSCFLALGVFLSSLVRDQIVAAIMTMAGCFALFLLGTNYIAPILDDWHAGLGTLLKNILSVTPHYDSFIRGIISVTDVIYFIVWIIVFLFLNGTYLEGRNRHEAKLFFTTSVVACLVIGMLFNYLVNDIPMGRLDCTQNKIYTTSNASQEIMKKLATKATLTIYISPQDQMPTHCKNLERDLTDQLKEIAIASQGKIEYVVEYLEVKNWVRDVQEEQQPKLKDKKTRQESKEDALEKKGIAPFTMPTLKESQYTNTLIYASLGIKYHNKPEKIIRRVLPQQLYELEYQIMRELYFLTLKQSPRVVLVAPSAGPMEQLSPYSMFEHLLKQENYEVQKISLEKESPLPDVDKYDLVVVIEPSQFNARQRWELARALRAGKPMLIAAQNYIFEYNINFDGGISANKHELEPQISEWLEKYGVDLHSDILMDFGSRGKQSDQRVDATNIMVTGNNMSRNFSMTNSLQEVVYISGAALQLDEKKLSENQLTHTVLMKSSPKAWLVDSKKRISSQDFSPQGKKMQQYPLMVLVQGQFPDAFPNQERPIWIKMDQRGRPTPVPDDKDNPEPAAQPVDPKPSTLLLIGCSQMLNYTPVRRGHQIMITMDAPENHALMMKSIDFLASNQELGKIPSRMVEAARIHKPESLMKWNLIFYVLVPLLAIIAGLIRSFWRQMRRNQYAQSLNHKNQAA